MSRIKKQLLFFLATLTFAGLSAQTNLVLQNTDLPQNHLINPALRPSSSLYIGLPVISGIRLNLKSNFFSFSDVFMKDKSGDSVISILHKGSDPAAFLAKIKSKNIIIPEASVQIFGLGFSVGHDGYFFIDINDRIEGNLVLPHDLFSLILEGNKQFAGSSINLSQFGGDFKYYREAGLGYSMNITERLRVGIKGKMLFGIAGFSIDNRSFQVAVDKNYIHTMDADLVVNLSGPFSVKLNSDHTLNNIAIDESRINTSAGLKTLLSGMNNTGMGLDAGATYDITDKFTISAAMTDLGFIRWKNDVSNLEAKSKYVFRGVNIIDVINGTKTVDELGNEMADSLKKAFSFYDSHKSFSETLPYNLTFGASYHLSKIVSFGLTSESRISKYQVWETVELTANLNVIKNISAYLSYSLSNQQVNNLGAGVVAKSGIFQFYLLSDKIPLMWNKINVDKVNSITIPANMNTLNLRMGVNLIFGKTGRENLKSDPMIR